MTLPGHLFASLWQSVVPSAGAIVARPWDGRTAAEFKEISLLLAGAADDHVPPEIEAYLAAEAVPFACTVTAGPERDFVVMCALDEVAIAIHPAFPNRLPGIARKPSGMLSAMKAARTSSGCYADLAAIGMVVPKGHLVTRARPRPNDGDDASGIDLAHQFDHLTLVAYPKHGRTLRFIAPSPRKFFVSPDRMDHVGLAPIAEDRDDLAFVTSQRGTRAYLDAVPKEPELSDRIRAAVVGMLDEGAGVIVLPELVTSADAASALGATLAARGSTTSCLIVVGTGPTTSLEDGSQRPHNEAVLMGSNGRVLAKQRKLHLFNMAIGRMRDCDITPANGCEGRSHMEDAACGTELIVCDLHGLGRVMTLICEDLQQQDPGGDLALVLRPDWILTPVLDIDQNEGRWTHARAIEIGRKTLSRVVISCCATLGVRMAKAEKLVDAAATIKTGICFDGANRNRVKIVQPTGAHAPERIVVRWDSSSWPTHRLVLNIP